MPAKNATKWSEVPGKLKSGEYVDSRIYSDRQIFEEDVYYTFPPSPEAKKLLNKFLHKLSTEEQEIFTEIVRIQREIEPMYGY